MPQDHKCAVCDAWGSWGFLRAAGFGYLWACREHREQVEKMAKKDR